MCATQEADRSKAGRGPSLAEDNETLARDYEAISGRVLAQPPFPRPRDTVYRVDDDVYRVDDEEMRTLLETAGFEVIGIELYDVPHVHASVDTAVRYTESRSFGNLLAHLPRELRVSDVTAIAAAYGTIAQQGPRMIALAVKRNRP